MKLYELTINEAYRLLRERRISALELTRSVLGRIEAVENRVDAYLTLDAEKALDQARAADKRIESGNAGPLTGIPLAVKDLICTLGLRTTCASKILENYVPPYDATVSEKLKKAGAIFLGKVNMDEFAMGSSTENSGFKLTRNPWNPDCVSGGSSGGSAAAVAADMCLGSVGSDTGGSIRQPASHCGVVGMKPTYGRVSRYGLVAYASSLDQIGPITKDVTDCALLMNAIAGHDAKDSTSVPREVPDYSRNLKTGLGDIIVGLPREYHESRGLDPDVARAVDNAKAVLKDLDARFVDVSLPHTPYAVAAYYVIAPAEASSNLARYDGVRFGVRDRSADSLQEMFRRTRSRGFGAEVKRRIILGTYALSAGYYEAYYGKASQVRTLIMEDFKKAFETCHVLLAPVAPTPAFKIGENTDDPLTMYLSDIFTIPANLAGIPGMSVPCGFSSKGLPIGLQLMARHFDEDTLFKVGYNFEQVSDFHDKKPTL